jgi:lipopolysaccharide/colanic/teichoic acid biosynthesis glycosyltransferase
VVLLVFSPVMALVAMAILIRMGPPVLFRQVRPGYRGAPFEVLKFRTMRDACDRDGKPLPDAERLTPLGRFLRRTSLDELPQLWNVVRGEMSLVGPRPLLMEYLDRYSPEQARRHDVKPGITGLAQINGRNAIPWEHKFDLDVWYVDHWSLWLDLRILIGTVRKVLKGEGISGGGVPTMTKFGEEPEARP